MEIEVVTHWLLFQGQEILGGGGSRWFKIFLVKC